MGIYPMPAWGASVDSSEGWLAVGSTVDESRRSGGDGRSRAASDTADWTWER